MRRGVGDAVDLRRTEVALEGGDDLRGRLVVAAADVDAVAVFGAASSAAR